MGMDTVEMVMEMERKLSLAFDDRDIEQVATLGEMVELGCRLRGVTDDGGELETQLTEDVLAALRIAGIETMGLGKDTAFFSLFPDVEGEAWEAFRRALDCDLPSPVVKFRKRLGLFYANPPYYDYQKLTLRDVVRVVGIQRILADQIQLPPGSQLGVELVVFAVTAQQGGLDPYGLRSWHSFANDLGLD